MGLIRRQFLSFGLPTVLLPVLGCIANAQAYPDRPVHLVVGFPAGSPADIVARLIAQSLSECLGQPVIVDNRPGAAGNIGAEVVAKSAADGNTLLLITTAYTTNASLYRSLNYNLARDIVPIAGINISPFVLIASPSLPAKNIAELISYAKSNPSKITMASSGVGSPPHIFGVLFEMMAGIDLIHVPYASNYLPDLLSGQVQVAFTPIQSPIGYIRNGQLEALAVTSAKRSESLPSVPAVAEFVPGYEANGWIGIGAPKGISAPIIQKLNDAVNRVIEDALVKNRLAALGTVPMHMTPVEFAKFIADETDKWATTINFRSIRID